METAGKVRKVEVRRWESLTPEERDLFFRRSETDIAEVMDSVQAVVETVRERGDDGLRELTMKFDGVDLSDLPLQVTKEEFDRAEASLEGRVREALEYAIENVRSFHRSQKPEGMTMQEVRPGILAGERATPIDSAGLYVPKGRGNFPSMLYMLALPAVIAGVPRVCIATPPGEGGRIDPACLVAARLCGIEEIYRIGGAQAIAAFAYGTESIPKVVKVNGPGSMYVAAAKRIVSGAIDVGMPAGPSESIVLADDTADPKRIALDLLIEAEHGSDSSAVLLTASTELAEAVAGLLPEMIAKLPEPRRSFVKDVLSGYGGIFVTETLEEAADIINDFAPEHLLVHTKDPFELLPLVRNAGEILLGPYTPFSVANYAAGANAVLPTGGAAKTYSAVSVRNFLKFSSVIYASELGYREMKPHVVALAEYEGFVTHAAALEDRPE
jgi:histidinol dehydrogenase